MRNETKYAVRLLSIGILAALVLDLLVMAQQPGTVKITPIGSRTGEYCRFDRALILKHATGIRTLYDPGITVAGVTALQTVQTGNTTTAEIAAAKNSAVLVNGSMAGFLAGKIRNIRGVSAPLCFPNHPRLAVVNVDGVDGVDGVGSMGPEEAVYAMKQLVQPTAVIASHPEEPVTTDGRVNPETRTAQLFRLLSDMPVYVPLSGRTMEFDGDANCVGCSGQTAPAGKAGNRVRGR